ncbi:tetratricopeptide repeat protein [Myxococcota bacterium]|nr:tetratricopeptide repeat protein [Myxococcota bacterium]
MNDRRPWSIATRSRRLLLTLVLALTGALALTVLPPDPSAHAADKTKKKETTKKADGKKAAKKKDAGKDAKAGDDAAADEAADAKAGDGTPGEEAAAAADDPLKRQGAANLKIETAIDQKQFARTQQADQKRDEAIEELKKLIPKAPAGRKAEMIFRLAELYWEKSKYKFGLEMTAFDKAYNQWVDAGRPGKEPAQKDHIRESELIKQNALKLYEKVLTEYPTYERNDEVLFYLGYNEYEAGNKKNAVNHYWTLIKQFPQSRLVPDAYLQLGEHFFNDNNVEKARKAFERALASTTPRIYNYALYKLAWCDYNVQEYAAGIVKLKDVIDRSEKAEAQKDTKTLQLKGEALGDLARFFSYVDEVETAFDYFKKKGGEDLAVRYTTKLGGLFDEQGKWPLQIKTYRMLNEKYPMNAKAPELQSLIVRAYSKLNKKDMVRKEVERLVDLYRPGTPWYQDQEKKKDKAALEYAYDLTESNLRDLVTEYHADAQKRQDVPTYQLAKDIYAKYLDAFSDTESAYSMRFFYAEVLWALKQWKNAAGEYDKVARAKVDKKEKGKYARNAAYNAILAYEKWASEGAEGKLEEGKKIDEKAKKGKSDADREVKTIKIANLEKDKKYDEQPIPDLELKLSAACDLYFDIADQKDQDLPAIKFKAAFIYYKHNHFIEAAQRYYEIIERWPGDELSKKSANLILDSLNVQEKWDELEKYARGFRDNKKLVGSDKKFAEETQMLVEGASFKSILTAEAKARDDKAEDSKRAGLAKAATRFRGFQKEFPESQYADKAMYNAVTIYDKADELDSAIEAAELLVKKYEKSDLAEKTAFLLAGFYERVADFDTAAKLYAGFYDKYKKSKQASDALFNSGVYYQGLGDSKKALEKFELYTKEFADSADASEVYWRTCEISEEDQNWKKAAECYDKFRDKYKKASQARVFESRYKLALMKEQLKQKPDADREYKWIVAQFPKLTDKEREAPGARLAGAHAAFELLEPEYGEYARKKITLQKQSLLDKATKADDLACVSSEGKPCKKEGKYLSILTYGNGDYGICALTRMGQVYRGMADSIRNAPLPRNLDEEQVEIYRAELDNVALGPEEKAIEAFENSLKKAYELNIYNKCTLTAQSNLKELNPAKFPDLQKRELKGAEGFFVASIRGSVPVAAPVKEVAPEKPAEPSIEDRVKNRKAPEPEPADEEGEDGEGGEEEAAADDAKGAEE